MKKVIIIAFTVIATSLAVFAGVNSQELTGKEESCNKTECCPTDLPTKTCCKKSTCKL